MTQKKVGHFGLNPKPDNNKYNIIYGFGYAKYIHKSNNIKQELTVFVPKEDSCKVSILKLENSSPNKKNLKLYYYVKPVIGEDELKSSLNISLDVDIKNNIICAKKIYDIDKNNTNIYVSSSEKISGYTGNKKFFLGTGGLSNPDGIKKIKLNNENSYGKKACICYSIDIELESFGTKELIICLGAEDKTIDCKNMAYKYSKISNAKQELEKVQNYWKDILGRLTINTPIESMDILLNGFMQYQTIQSRMIARTGYYQSGGAFGYRDQLQDAIGLKFIDSDILKNQIIKHSKKQFVEGDVLHWWHEDTGKGVRTKFSDDLLWLPYCIIEYIDFTGDYSILDIKTKYLKGNILEKDEDEKYDIYLDSDIEESIYNHAIKAIDKKLDFGKNNLPKIGCGDWNDGFSTVGNKGIGESVWLRILLI